MDQYFLGRRSANDVCGNYGSDSLLSWAERSSICGVTVPPITGACILSSKSASSRLESLFHLRQVAKGCLLKVCQIIRDMVVA